MCPTNAGLDAGETSVEVTIRAMSEPLHLVDTTMFWSPTGGGVRRYLQTKHEWLATAAALAPFDRGAARRRLGRERRHAAFAAPARQRRLSAAGEPRRDPGASSSASRPI
jgi:hypothetical protein